MRLDGPYPGHVEGLLCSQLVLGTRLLGMRAWLTTAWSRLLRLWRHLACDVGWMLSGLSGLLLPWLLDAGVLLEPRMLLYGNTCCLSWADWTRSRGANLGSRRPWSLRHSDSSCLVGITWVMLGMDGTSWSVDGELVLEVGRSGHVVGCHWPLLLLLGCSGLGLLLSRCCGCCLLLGNGRLLSGKLLLLLLLLLG